VKSVKRTLSIGRVTSSLTEDYQKSADPSSLILGGAGWPVAFIPTIVVQCLSSGSRGHACSTVHYASVELKDAVATSEAVER
jgi:hypothetical protein